MGSPDFLTGSGSCRKEHVVVYFDASTFSSVWHFILVGTNIFRETNFIRFHAMNRIVATIIETNVWKFK